jgi:hypothetical protein
LYERLYIIRYFPPWNAPAAFALAVFRSMALRLCFSLSKNAPCPAGPETV